MTTELSLQNSISLEEQKIVRKKLAAKKDVDYSKYQVGATAYAPKGHLINDPLWKAPINGVKDTFQNVKNIGKGLKGEGNDHNLGMMNDLTMKVGGLAVAGYLATRRVLPVAKGMEFVGFASFFTSMALFPKIFINAPIKALYGFNVDQKCIDSQGRKNNVHRDPQYFVSDLYSSEQLEAIGDKMGVDKNMENRQGLVKDKMTKISTQANTLWMLTAGLATPIMGALISSQVEKGLNILHQKVKTPKVDGRFAALGEKLSKVNEVETQKLPEELNTLLSENRDKAVGPKFVDNLTTMIAGNDNRMLQTRLKKDLVGLLESGHVSDLSEFLGNIEVTAPVLVGSETKTAAKTLSKESIKEILVSKGLNNNIDIAKHKDGIKNILADAFIGVTEDSDEAATPEARATREALGDAFSAAFDTKFQTAPMKLTSDKINVIESVYKSFGSFRKQSAVIDEYVSYKVGDREDSVMAREWKKSTEGIFNALGFNDKDLAEAKKSPANSRKIMEAKFVQLAGNDDKYQAAVKKIAECYASFETEVERGAIKGKDAQGKEITKGFVQGVTDAAVSIYSKLGTELAGHNIGGKPVFEKTANYISAHFEKPASIKRREMAIASSSDDKKIAEEELKIKKIRESILPKSAAFNVINSAENKVVGAKSSMVKVLHGLDVYRRLTNPKQVEKLKATLKAAGRTDEYIAANFGKITEVMKYAVMDATLGTHSVKFDLADKEVYKDSMALLYCMDKKHIGSKVKAFLTADKTFKDDKLMEDYLAGLPDAVDLDPSTVKALGEKSTAKLRAHLADTADITVNDHYRFKPGYTFINPDFRDGYHPENFDNGKIKGFREAFSKTTTTLRKQMMVGETAANLTEKITEQKSNTKHWLKLFGGIGAGVAAVTLIAPLFFGKIDEPKAVKKEVASNG